MLVSQNSRQSPRNKVAIDIRYGTAEGECAGRIVDISQTGARISGNPIAAGRRIYIDHDNMRSWATVRWAEIDRMGVEFDADANQGYQELQAAARTQAHHASARLLGVGPYANDNIRPVFGRKKVD